MRISIVVLLLLCTGIFTLTAKNSYSQSIQKVKISLHERAISLDAIFAQIEQKSGFHFVYKSDKVRSEHIPAISVQQMSIEKILMKLLYSRGFTFKQMGNNIIIDPAKEPIAPDLLKMENSAADIKVSGKVTSEKDGEPIPGVNVLVKGSNRGTATDAKGNYTIVVSEDAMLIFSFLGYQRHEEKVDNRSVINVALQPNLKQLNEVVVTGYRTQKRGTVTGSVASVNSSEFQEVPVDNLSNALSGRLSGVSISQEAGTPGMVSDIRVRSIGTFNNASPLYIIDGVVRDKYAFDSLTPNEVESISVLKDGASASIYGSRAANGVILVTTKSGSNQPASLSFQSTVGVETPTRMPESLNAYEHAKLINDAVAYDHYYDDNFTVPEDDERLYTQDELDYFKEHSWNWVDELTKTPVTLQQALNVSGGNENVRYFLGGSHNYSTASFDNLSYRKLNLRGNVDVDITSNLTASLNLSTNNRKTKGPNWGVNDWKQEDLYKNLVTRPELIPPYRNGKLVGNWTYWSPAAVLDRDISGYNDTEWTGLNATLEIDYQVPFVDGLAVNVKYNRHQRDQFIKRFSLPYDMTVFDTEGTHGHILGEEPTGINTRPLQEFLLNRNDREKSYQFNAQLNYKKMFGKHNLDALLVYEQTEATDNWFVGRRDNFLSQSVDQFVGGGRSLEEQRANGAEHESGRLSYVGSVNYDYDDTYLLQGSFRYDGSVIFSPENRWGFFPSGSVGWRISNESFFKSDFINDLMIRGSIGLVGNDNVGSFQWLQSYNIVDGAAFNSVSTGLEPGTLANTDITWEKSLSYNAGFNTHFLDNRMNLKVSAFYRHTYDILSPRVLSVPTTFGASLPDENYAEVDSKGYEIELEYGDNLGSGHSQFSYYVKGNFGYSTNEIVNVDVGENTRPYESKTGRPIGLSTGYNVSLNGTDILFGLEATDIIRTQEDLNNLPEGYTIFGETPQLGMLNYKDIRGPNSDEPDGRITNDDRQYLGKHSIPPMNYGLSVGGSWKSLSVDVLFQGAGGHKIMLHPNARRMQGRPNASSYKIWNDHWTIDNRDAAYPAVRDAGWPPTDYRASSWFVKNGSFLRLKNLSVSYGLPKGILNTKDIKLFYTGTNLFMVYDHIREWGYDPEASNIRAYPIMSTHSFGINVEI